MKKLFYFASIAALAFSSCSKDSTDVVAPATPVGKTAFTATMSIGEGETRHGLGTNAEGKRVYVWDKGDMVSVNSDLQPAKNLPFITVNGGTEAAFTAVADDLNFLGREGVNYYMTYPWCDKSFVESWIDEDTGESYAYIYGLQVPSEQRYRENSFATMTAPAFMVTPAEDVNDGDELEFKSAASYFRVPVKGVGKLQQLSLYIDGQTIAGDIGVYVTSDEEEAEEYDMKKLGDNYYEIWNAGQYAVTNTADGMPGSTSEIVVDFGATPLELDPTTAKDIYFVIKSGIYLEGAEIGHTAWLEDAEEPQVVSYDYPTWGGAVDEQYGDVENQWENIQPNMVFHGKPIVLGVDGYAVNNEADFITWAYVNWMINYPDDTTNPLNESGSNWIDVQKLQQAIVEAGILAEEIVPDGDVNSVVIKFQPAILLSDLDFANVDENDAATELQKLAMAWFKNNIAKNGAMIPTLKGAEIIGNDFEMANLEVGGAAFMADAELDTRAATTTIHSKISNVTLKNFSIEAAEDAKRVNFFLKNHANGTNIEDVTIDGGSLNGGTATATKHIVHNSYATTFEELAVSTYPVAGEDDAPYTYNFYMNDDADLSDIYAGNANAITNLVGSEAAAVAVVNDVEGVVENVMQAVEMPVREKWFSVVIDEVSYWTGATALSVRSAANEEDVYGAYYTAEELMRHREHNGASTMTLTNNIDFRNIAIGYTGYADIVNTVVGNNKTISNVNITNKVVAADGTVSYNVAKEGQNYALFGHTADIKDLNVDGLNVDVQVGADWAVVSGLSYYGKAENVSVINGVVSLTGSKDFDIKYLRTAFGVVFGKANAADIKNVYVKANIVNGIDIPTMTMSAVGLVAGELTVADDTEIAAGYSGGVNGTKAISMWKSGSFDATKLYTTDKDGKVTGPAANIYSGKMFGTVKVTGIPESTTEKHIRDFHVVAPANAPEGWVNPITEKSSKAYAQHIAGGFTFDVLNEDFHLDINFYDGAYEQDLAYVKPVAEKK